MPMKQGGYAGGIRSLQDVMQRCRVDKDTGCWALTINSRGCPMAWWPITRRNSSVIRIVAYYKAGRKPLPPDKVAYRTCGCSDCVAPRHIAVGTVAQCMKAAGLKPRADSIAKMIATRRARSRISEQARQEIAAGIDPLKVIAERHNISLSYVYELRRKGTRPIRLSSVFAWRPNA